MLWFQYRVSVFVFVNWVAGSLIYGMQNEHSRNAAGRTIHASNKKCMKIANDIWVLRYCKWTHSEFVKKNEGYIMKCTLPLLSIPKSHSEIKIVGSHYAGRAETQCLFTGATLLLGSTLLPALFPTWVGMSLF